MRALVPGRCVRVCLNLMRFSITQWFIHNEQLEPEVAGHEDERALCGGDDGLDVVREVLLAAPRLLRQGGPRAVWLEVDPSHPPLIEAWLRDARPDLGMELARAEWDVFGRLRFCEVRWRGGVE